MGKQINQYSKTRTFADLTDEDLFDVDSTDDAGTSWESAKLTVLNLIRYINNNAKTYYNENGSINEDREVSMNTFNAKWIGGNIVAQMSDAINDYGFIVNDDALVEKARLGYDQSTLSSIFSLFDSTGEYINANNGKLKVGNSPGPSTATLVVQGILNASTTNFTVYGGTLSGRTDIGVSANNPNISMFDGAGIQQMNFDSGSSSSWTLRPFGVNIVGGTARLSVKALSNGTDQAFRIRNNTDTLDLLKVQGNGRFAIGDITTPSAKLEILGEGTGTGIGLMVKDSAGVKNLSIFDNGRVVVGRDVSGSFDYGVHLKSFDLTNFVTIEDSAGNDYYNFNAGSMFIRSFGNIAAIKMGGLLSTDSIEARGRYTGVHDWEIYNPVAATIIARIRAASNVGGTTAGGIVHLDMANNGGVKIGGNATYDPLNKLDIRNASNNRMLVIEEAGRITSVWGSGIAAATIPFRTKRSNGTLMGYIGSDASGHGYIAVADVGGVEKSRIVAEGESNINGDLNVDGDYKVNGNAGFTGTGPYTNFTIEGGIITAAS